jgi:hypothetical protein
MFNKKAINKFNSSKFAPRHINNKAISDVVTLQSLERLVHIIHLHNFNCRGQALFYTEFQYFLRLSYASNETTRYGLPPCKQSADSELINTLILAFSWLKQIKADYPLTQHHHRRNKLQRFVDDSHEDQLPIQLEQ